MQENNSSLLSKGLPQGLVHPEKLDKCYFGCQNLTSLHLAAANGDLDLVNKLLSEGANVNACCCMPSLPHDGSSENGPAGPTALHFAASQGHGKVVEALLQAGAEVEPIAWIWNCNEKVWASDPEDFSVTPLLVAAKNGHEEICLKLHDAGASIAFEHSKDHPNVASYAAGKGMLKLLDRCIDAKVPGVVRKNSSPDHALNHAARFGKVEAFKKIWECVKDLESFLDGGDRDLRLTGLLRSAAFSGSTKLFTFCLEQGNPDAKETVAVPSACLAAPLNIGILELAFVGGNVEIFQKIVQLGIFEDISGALQDSLFYSVLADEPDNGIKMLTYLLQHLNQWSILIDPVWNDYQLYLVKERFTVTPLLLACASLPQAVPMLLEAGANPNFLSTHDVSALHMLASCWPEKNASNQEHYAAAFKALLAAGLDVNAKTAQGITPLHLACASGIPYAIELFIKAGANIHAAVEHPLTSHFPAGATPLQMFLSYMRSDIGHATDSMKILVNAGANVLAPSSLDSISLLHFAASWSRFHETKLRVDRYEILEEAMLFERDDYFDKCCKGQADKIALLIASGCDPCADIPLKGTPLQMAVHHFQTDSLEDCLQAKNRALLVTMVLPLIKAGDCSLECFFEEVEWPGLEEAIEGFTTIPPRPSCPGSSLLHARKIRLSPPIRRPLSREERRVQPK